MRATGRERQEWIGVAVIFCSASMWGLFPVFVNQGAKEIPPFTFAALALGCSAVGFLVYSLFTGRLPELRRRQAYRPALMVTLLIIAIPYTLFFLGASQTSGVNTSLLLLAEMVFTVAFTPFFGEKTTTLKLLGAGGVLLGAILIVYNGQTALNPGDLLIILSTVTYPFGNLFTKRALHHLAPATLLLVRSTLGGLFMLVLARLLEPEVDLAAVVADHWVILLLTGLVTMGAAKILWHEGLKRVDISKAVALGSVSPAISLLVLVLVLQEKISVYQGIGIAVMALGVYFSIRRRSTDPALTRYAPVAE